MKFELNAARNIRLSRLLNLVAQYQSGRSLPLDELAGVKLFIPLIESVKLAQATGEIPDPDWQRLLSLIDDPAPATDCPLDAVVEKVAEVSDFGLRLGLLPGVPMPRKLTGFYKLGYKSYAPLFCCDERTIKRWVTTGKKAVPHDLPPLDAPANMPAWWRRHFAQKVPDSILAAATKSEANRAVDSAPLPRDDAAPPSIENAQRDFSKIETLDLLGNLAALRKNVAVNKHLLDEAMQGALLNGRFVVDEALVSIRQKAYEGTMKILRSCENDALDYQAKAGLLAPRDEVRAENNRLAAAVFSAVKRLVKTVRPQLVGRLDHEQDAIWNAETERCFIVLKTARFTEADVVLAAN